MQKRRIKSYGRFMEDRINEGFVDWIKEKFQKIGQYFNELKGKALVAIASSILPKELVDYIRQQAGFPISESVLISEEIKRFGMGIGSDFEMLSNEELDSLSEKEYDEYLQKVANNIVFEVDVEGNVIEQDKELHDFLISRGININTETIVKHEKSLNNIYNKIDGLNINQYAKKALKFASVILFFGMIAFKSTGAHAATIDSGFDGVKKFTDTQDGDDGGDDGGDDPRSLWDKLTGKKVSTTHTHYTDKQIETKAKAKNMSKEEYLKYLQEEGGWKLDSVKSDTIHKIIQIQKPDTKINITELSFDIDGDQFLTGKYELSPEVKSGILSEIDKISEKGGIITNYAIESSTDKEPIKMGNDVLAQKRAEAVSNELVNLGIDKSLITIKTLPEQGPDIYTKTMTDKERVDARVETKDFRYVKIHILYYEKDIKAIPEINQEFDKVKNTYYFSKETISKPPHTPPFKGNKTTKTTTKQNKGSGKKIIDDCWYQ